ncbi:putative RNA-directed DNA polymerase from transposon X-element [Trichonephila clavata]|uniref:Putative RNA-directed DNA polymerase from transposon X-element n=1 Tax=Trichonephila clavata TaxID=2740835 RepID=A0A8X6KYU5_TRICU|nr:putative RNA-directed DNA polymerase from transposon X-element [Trichonephila clavata]
MSLQMPSCWGLENNITINLGKTSNQNFTLNMQPFTSNHPCRGSRLQYKDVSTNLGFNFYNKLKWTKHVEHEVSKVRNRLPILNRLAGAKWGYGTHLHITILMIQSLL